MRDILYFPHYSPNSANLRTLLLFYDEVHTIVPRIDQQYVSDREHVAQLMDLNCQINYFDPSYRYSDWIEDDEVKKAFYRLVDESSNDYEANRIVESIAYTDWGVADWNQEETIKRLEEKGWKLLAAQKIPPREVDNLRQKKVAVPMRAYRSQKTGNITEHNPILMHPRIGNFILSRLARQISSEENIPSVTFEDHDFFNCLYSPERTKDFVKPLLMSSIISISIPDNIAEINVGEYDEIRMSYKPVRLRIERMLSDIAVDYRLNSIDDFEKIKSASIDAANDIEERVKEAMKHTSRRFFSAHNCFNQSVLWGILGGLAGFALGGVAGAAVSGAVAPVASELAKKLCPPLPENDMVNTLAAVRASIATGVERSNFSLPPYMAHGL